MTCFKEVIIKDYSNYEPGMCSNGGKYLFKQVYRRNNDNNTYSVYYYTSAEFDYCDINGTWNSCRNCNNYNYDNGICESEREIVTLEELKKIIDKASQNPDEEVILI